MARPGLDEDGRRWDAFLRGDDPRMRGTMKAIEERLTTDGFVARYPTVPEVDGLPPGEGAFLLGRVGTASW